MGFGAISITKSCKCEEKDKSNWEIVEPRRGKKTALVSCKVCRNQWRTSAKYIDELPYANYIKSSGK